MNRQSIIDACERIRDRVAQFGADQDNLTFWHWDRAFWYATRALIQMGIVGVYKDGDVHDQIAGATRMIERSL